MYEFEETKTKKPDFNYFGRWFRSLDEDQQDKLKPKIIKDCIITDQIFRHWKCGNSKVPPLAQVKINEIAGRDIFKDEDYGHNQQSETNHRNT